MQKRQLCFGQNRLFDASNNELQQPAAASMLTPTGPLLSASQFQGPN
jgi:hypothetical protein